MDQRWVDLIQKIHREGFAEVVFRFPSQPRRAEGFVVLSPLPGTDVDELARRVAEFLRPKGPGCVCFLDAVSSSRAVWFAARAKAPGGRKLAVGRRKKGNRPKATGVARAPKERK
jgi:hypothetical protein